MSQHIGSYPIQYRRYRVLWFVLLLLGVGSAVSSAIEPAPSRPYWTGQIEQDTTWRDTVYVGGDVTIAATATLTLAPNTKVLFLSYRDDARGGLDSTRAELIVEGRLVAHAGGIVFGSADSGSLGADWYGLVVEQGGQADISHAAVRDGLRCLYAKRGGFITMDALTFANCGKPTAPADWDSTLASGAVEAATVASDSMQIDAGRAIGGSKENSDGLSPRLGRIARKLIFGTLGGITLGIMVGASTSGSYNGDAIGGYNSALAGFFLGYGAGTVVSVHFSDRQARFSGVLAGGTVGVWVGVKTISKTEVPMLICPVAFATIASELWRDAPEDSRLSISLAPYPKGYLAAAATLRF